MYSCTHVLLVPMYCGTSSYPDSSWVYSGMGWGGGVRAPTIRERGWKKGGDEGRTDEGRGGGSVFRQTPLSLVTINPPSSLGPMLILCKYTSTTWYCTVLLDYVMYSAVPTAVLLRSTQRYYKN